MEDRIGQYQILREVGRGGMGVVYLGRDARLDRDVAIKALPEHLANDPARLERFEREAKSLASMSHPNLAGIYGVEEQDGARYLVLEYVDGETLADRLDRGPLDVDEAIELAAQIAAGIEEAHKANVIHRDLKPANIKITSDGVAKVLDFGLARYDESGSSTGVAEAATVTTPQSLTMAGAILGTAAYMSPEQARGRRVDKRTDVWSFGVLLYEMLVGANPFIGETVSDSIGAILHKDIDLARLPVNTPAKVRRVLDRCLVRDKSNRYRDIGDVRLELLQPDTDPNAGAAPPGLPVRSIVLPLLLCATLIGAGLAWWLKPSDPPVPLPVFEADIALPAEQRLAHRFAPGIAISPDGQSLVFCAGAPEKLDSTLDIYFRGQLMIRRLGQPAAVPVSGAEKPAQPTFSPDGSSIAYVSNGRTIARIPVAGGRSTRLVDADGFVGGLSWAADGRILFGSRKGIKSIADTGGPMTTLTTVDAGAGEAAHVFPHVLPDGRGTLFTAWPLSEQADLFTVWVLDGRTGERHKLIDHAAHPEFADGHIVFARQGTLMAVPFDCEPLTLTGDPKPVGVEVVHSLYGPNTIARNSSAQFAVSPTGNLAYARGSVWPEIPRTVAWVDREGNVTELDLQPRGYGAARVSADGTRSLLTVFYDPTAALWVHDAKRGVTRRAHGSTNLSWGLWGPGDQEITFNQTLADRESSVGWVEIGDTRDPKHPGATVDASRVLAAEWSADRKHLICLVSGQDVRSDIAAWSDSDGWTRITDTPGVGETYPTLSPDGRWLAHCSSESGRLEVYVRPFMRDGPVTQVTDGGASSPLWSRDGTELFYRSGVSSASPEKWVMAVPVSESGDRLAFGAPERLFDDSAFGRTVPIRSWDVGPDGRFLMTRRPTPDDLQEAVEAFFPDRIRLIQNWTSRLAD